MLPRERIRLEEVIIGSGELGFVGNLEKSRFRTHLKSFALFQVKDQKKKKKEREQLLPA